MRPADLEILLTLTRGVLPMALRTSGMMPGRSASCWREWGPWLMVDRSWGVLGEIGVTRGSMCGDRTVTWAHPCATCSGWAGPA